VFENVRRPRPGMGAVGTPSSGGGDRLHPAGKRVVAPELHEVESGTTEEPLEAGFRQPTEKQLPESHGFFEVPNDRLHRALAEFVAAAPPNGSQFAAHPVPGRHVFWHPPPGWLELAPFRMTDRIRRAEGFDTP